MKTLKLFKLNFYGPRRFYSKSLILAGLLLSLLVIPVAANASSLSFEKNVIAVQAGETFSVPVVINPLGQRQYTMRFTLSFPPEMLEVSSFSFNSDWISIAQPGYDLVDNRSGQLIKTAGFPKGFIIPKSFGKVTFRSKMAGEATISVGPKTFVLDSKNVNTLASRPQIKVIAGKGVAPETSTIEPLPNLPAVGDNLFDVSLAPGQQPASLSPSFYIILLIIVLILAIVGWFIVGSIRRRSVVSTMKDDKNIQN